LQKQNNLLKEEQDRLEELKEENAHQVDELESQLEKLKEQLKHLKFLQDKEKKETETMNADNFVNQMNMMYTSIGVTPPPASSSLPMLSGGAAG